LLSKVTDAIHKSNEDNLQCQPEDDSETGALLITMRDLWKCCFFDYRSYKQRNYSLL